MFVTWLFIFFNSCEILPDCDVTDFQLVIFLTKRKIVLHFDLHKKILDMHIQNASVFERSLSYKYVCETWRLIRLNSKINPHIKKFANPKKTQWFSDPFAVHICNDIYYWSDDTCKLCTCIWCPFWLNTNMHEGTYLKWSGQTNCEETNIDLYISFSEENLSIKNIFL